MVDRELSLIAPGTARDCLRAASTAVMRQNAQPEAGETKAAKKDRLPKITRPTN